jgi:hypothetical protein
LGNAANPFSKVLLQEIQLAGQGQTVEVVPFLVKAGPELDAVFPQMIGKQVQAVIVQGSL